ncbi:uncharacterized protein Tco025E_03197 [Trypanosoma conorhini]|uniref:Uncharacterized protein n=1 Tax=Trypanosoma conorhini TaxID=83891 RepID=A0A422PX76_9TRYP|nr:uncharacterized protein Tco025E_03197 [Trypanosoma conorhini]RNF22355.1 hypothetical protein Tco025E_03197 [Trypanosoma conorhini]
MRAIQDRCQELGVENPLLYESNSHEGGSEEKAAQSVTVDNWNSDTVVLHICEKSLQLSEQDKDCTNDVPTLMENLTTRKGMRSATERHCVAIIKSLARHHPTFKNEKVYQSALTSVFSRVKTRLPIGPMLSLILDGVKAGVSREALTDSLSWVGGRLLGEDMANTSPKVLANYFVAAHELNFLHTAAHPLFIGAFQHEKAIELLSPQLAARLFAALCALGVDNRSLLECILNRVELWCLKLLKTVGWSEEDWKASLVLVHALWTSASEVVWNQLMQITHKLVSHMIERATEPKTRDYSLLVASAAATFSIHNAADKVATQRKGKAFSFEQLPGFLNVVTSLFSEDGIAFSLPRTDLLLRSEVKTPIIPQYSNITHFIITAHAVQRLSQSENKLSKRLTPLGVSLWRYCLKHLEKTPITDNTLLTAVGFSIRFGASSQAFDRCMSALIEKEDNVNLLSVCFIADGLVRAGKRRSVATQFVAHFSQRNCLDDLPAAALFSLLSFFARDAERVALGLTRADMLITLVWSSLSLKLARLSGTTNLWTLVETVPVESRQSLLGFFVESGLVEASSVMELLPPVSTVLAWQHNLANSVYVSNFLARVKASLVHRGNNQTTLDPVAEEILKKISERM